MFDLKEKQAHFFNKFTDEVTFKFLDGINDKISPFNPKVLQERHIEILKRANRSVSLEKVL